MSTTKKPFYPESCPECHGDTGWPYSAGTCDRPDVIRVKLRCQRCGHEWSGDAPDAPVAVALWPRRPDRRRANNSRRRVQ
jgi:hypothetical protein